jgi:PAS domain S-box-containing protein
MKWSERLRLHLPRLPLDVILVYLLVNAVLIVGSWLYLQRYRERSVRREFDQLEAIVSLKVDQIASWRWERLKEALLFTDFSFHGRSFERFFSHPADPAVQQEFAEFARQVNSDGRYQYLGILNSANEVLLSTSPDMPDPSALPHTLLPQMSNIGSPILSDLFRLPDGRIFLAVISPLAGRGRLLLFIDPNTYLFGLVAEWPTPSLTAETLLVRPEGDRVLFLNELRHRRGTALILSFPAANDSMPAARAIRDWAGTMEGIDYRGVTVLAAYRRVSASVWSVVAKIDREEVEAPIQEMSRLFVAIAASFALASASFVFLRLRQLTLHQTRERTALVSHFDYLARYANDIILLLDQLGRITEANDRAISAYGYPRDRLLALRFADLCADCSEGRIENLKEKLKESDGAIFVSTHKRSDGNPVPVEISMRAIEAQGSRYVQCIIRDISERKKAEMEKDRLESQLAQLKKIEAIGRLAGGIAHDFNNILTAITAYGEYLRMKIPPETGMKSSVEGILAAAARAARLTQGLLAFSEKQQLAWKVLDLNAIVRMGREELSRIMGEGIRIQLELHPEPLPVMTDREQLTQVLHNLAANAREAMPNGGLFTIRTALVHATAVATLRVLAPPRGLFACLTVADTGVGMDTETRERLFDPFFTTKGFGRGAGMGLPVVYGIIQQHNGAIAISSERSKGTEFKIYLPISEAVNKSLILEDETLDRG